MSLRILTLYVLRALGFFAVAQWLTRKRLRILCYHGFALGDEYQIAPFMFMRAATFERRLEILKRRGVPVIPLDVAVEQHKKGAIRRAETVITLDDGWESNLSVGLPVLKRYGFPACVYVTTEHLDSTAEVFNVVLTYMIARSSVQVLVLADIHPNVDGEYAIRTNYSPAVLALIAAVEKNFPFGERIGALSKIATALGFELDKILEHRRFRLMTRAEMTELYGHGVDLQLHTHTHRLPNDAEATAREITQNQAAVKTVLGEEKKHFCYPSGAYGADHPAWLAKLGIVSATTCDSGMNPAGTSPFLLKRYLDQDASPDIEFEAEVAGVREIFRTLRGSTRVREAHGT
jgi:peptidoglycan/xylan/chitin deacetylase (PgdA/CDA1 family)